MGTRAVSVFGVASVGGAVETQYCSRAAAAGRSLLSDSRVAVGGQLKAGPLSVSASGPVRADNTADDGATAGAPGNRTRWPR